MRFARRGTAIRPLAGLAAGAGLIAVAGGLWAAGTPGAAPGTAVDARPVLELRALDKITGRAKALYAPVGTPVRYATLTITVRQCYSTPASETPETSAFLQIVDQRPHQKPRSVFSGWMYASSPGLNGMEHPIYDVWAIKCITKAPGQSVDGSSPPPSASASTVEDETAAPEVPDGPDENDPGTETGH